MKLEDLTFDAEGNCLLQIGDDAFVNVCRDEKLSRYVITSTVAPDLPETLTHDLTEDLLAYALGPIFGGAPALGRDPSDGKLIAYSLLPFAIATEVEFPEQLETFCTFRSNLVRLFEALAHGETVLSASNLLHGDVNELIHI